MQQFKVCVFCGSNPGNSPVFAKEARQLGQAIAEENWGMVYGGGGQGLMGETAKACLKSGEPVTGITPNFLLKADAGDGGLPGCEQIWVETMHQRKEKMATLSHAFVGLPGGFGTFEEIFEMTTWSQIGVHEKPVFLLDVDSFYAPLQELVTRAILAGFIPRNSASILRFFSSVEALIEALKAWEASQELESKKSGSFLDPRLA